MIEIAQDLSGNVVWKESYIFKRISASGEIIVRDSLRYLVIRSELDTKTDIISTVVSCLD